VSLRSYRLKKTSPYELVLAYSRRYAFVRFVYELALLTLFSCFVAGALTGDNCSGDYADIKCLAKTILLDTNKISFVRLPELIISVPPRIFSLLFILVILAFTFFFCIGYAKCAVDDFYLVAKGRRYMFDARSRFISLNRSFLGDFGNLMTVQISESRHEDAESVGFFSKYTVRLVFFGGYFHSLVECMSAAEAECIASEISCISGVPISRCHEGRH
jgi:hypothetical protein